MRLRTLVWLVIVALFLFVVLARSGGSGRLNRWMRSMHGQSESHR
jgi:hypothetical protein